MENYNPSMELKPQYHLGYIVDFDAFSIIFRPKRNTTDCIQYRRKEYTPENVEFLIDRIQEQIPHLKDHCVPATFVLQYFLKTNLLVSRSGRDASGTNHFWLRDRVTGVVYDPTKDQYQPKELATIYANGKTTSYYGFKGSPATAFFDLMVKVDPIAVRFEVEELITLKNKDGSTFFRDKWSMNYLAQNGVFG